MGQTQRLDWNPGLLNPQPLVHTAPLFPRGKSVSLHISSSTFPLFLKSSWKRCINSHSKKMAKSIIFYSCYLPLQQVLGFFAILMTVFQSLPFHTEEETDKITHFVNFNLNKSPIQESKQAQCPHLLRKST